MRRREFALLIPAAAIAQRAPIGESSDPILKAMRDEMTRAAALNFCQLQLDLADRIGARCCVNIVGSLGEKWDGPHPDNLSDDGFDLVVAMARAILRAACSSSANGIDLNSRAVS